MELNLKESYNLLKTLIKEHWVIYDFPGGLELITSVHLKANELSFITKSKLIVYPGKRIYILNSKDTPLRLFNNVSSKSLDFNIVTIDVSDITKYKYFGIIKLIEPMDIGSDINKLPETIFIEGGIIDDTYLKYTLMVDVVEENIGEKEYKKYYIVKYIDHNFNLYFKKYKPEDLIRLTFISPLKLK